MNDENSLMFENLFFTQTRGKSGSCTKCVIVEDVTRVVVYVNLVYFL